MKRLVFFACTSRSPLTLAGADSAAVRTETCPVRISADIPGLASPRSQSPRASTALHQSPCRFAPDVADAGRFGRTARTTPANDVPMSAPLVVDGRTRQHCPASRNGEAPSKHAARSSFLYSCVRLAPVGVSLHGSRRLHCVPFGRSPRISRFSQSTDVIVKCRPCSSLELNVAPLPGFAGFLRWNRRRCRCFQSYRCLAALRPSRPRLLRRRMTGGSFR